MNTSIEHQISSERHDAALAKFLNKTMLDDSPEADAYAKAINDRQWAIVAEGKYSMDDAFVLAVEQNQ